MNQAINQSISETVGLDSELLIIASQNAESLEDLAQAIKNSSHYERIISEEGLLFLSYWLDSVDSIHTVEDVVNELCGAL
jgi:hypothetical protein